MESIMKLGLISDIHAEADALRQALDAMQKQGVHQILCAGDLVERGSDGEAVINMIKERGILCVQGNHDARSAVNQRWLREKSESLPSFAEERLLSMESLDFLDELPPRLMLEYGGKNILLAHGTPWSNVQYVFPAIDVSFFERIRQEFKPDFVILGHTHMPMEITFYDMKVLNPGSLSQHDVRHGSTTYGILNLPEGTFEVYHLLYQMPYRIPRLNYPKNLAGN
jgi:putative phosphoesterase